MSRYIIISALVITFVVTGCFDAYLDIMPSSSGPSVLRRTLVLNNEFFAAMDSFASAKGDSAVRYNKLLIDSIIFQAKDEATKFRLINGVQSVTITDSSFDTSHYFATTITVASKSLLPGVANALMSSMDDNATNGEKDTTFHLSMTSLTSETAYDIKISPPKSQRDSVNLAFSMAIFGTHKFHVRLLSDKLVTGNDKNLKSCIGGEEWVIPMVGLTGVQELKTKKVRFLVKE